MKFPNILITGTPGNGKTTTSALLQFALGSDYEHIQIGDLVKTFDLHDGFDEEFNSYLINEDKVLDYLEDRMNLGGAIVDHHSAAFFPERWFDLVVCLTCDNSILYSRLEARGYKTNKIQENIECEIMQVVLEETRESYKPEILVVLSSNTTEEMESNVDRIEQWALTHASSLMANKK